MIFKPFRGLRPRSDLASKIPSVPYDVIDSEEARKLAADDPYSFLHVIKPEIDLEPDADPYGDGVYEKGRENFRAMLERGWFERDSRPSYYAYRLTLGQQRQTGLVGASSVEDYVKDRIKRHELTRPQKENDRVRLIEALSAIPGPVFLTYRGLPELNAMVNAIVAGVPAVDFPAPDGVRHELWVVDDRHASERIETLFRHVPVGYVADGHHRAAAAVRASRSRIEALDTPQGNESCRYFLTVYFPAEQLQVLDYNRVVADLNGLTPESLLERIGEAGFDIQPGHRSRRPPHRRCFGMYLDGAWYLLTAQPRLVPPTDLRGRLDVSILATHLLQPILGIGDPRTDRRVDFVGGARGMQELERRVACGSAAVAFALYPVSVEEIMQIADAGEIMPPKTTWFEPKLRSGLVVQQVDAEAL